MIIHGLFWIVVTFAVLWVVIDWPTTQLLLRWRWWLAVRSGFRSNWASGGAAGHRRPRVPCLRSRLLMRPHLLIALFIAAALTVGAALGFLLEQATQPSEQSEELPEQ